MKKLYAILAAVLITATVWAQSPQKMSYQAVIRNNSNQLITSHAVGMKISILQGSASGTAVYVETQLTNTNANGLVVIEIGGGTIISGTFASINWANGPYFIKTETDPAGDVNYTITGVSQLLSVPYALFSAKGPGNHYIGEAYGGGIVFYVYDDGRHGLIAATADLGSSIYCTVDSVHSIANAFRDGVGGGRYNTERIITHEEGRSCAAQLCANYKGGGFGDWYLPSKYELNLLCLQKSAVGGFAYTVYWSSTEFSYDRAWVQDFYPFGSSVQDASPKNHSAPTYVRAVRSF